ncbi:hypothetical protein B7R54_12110 [Subtercola boreus]|uniref:DUF58 domain-containing protein n=1 Tax=Subtercola boreus TaxID=120213 RepID=A0A3E0VK92_9MICO|nr:DUF58 domain-containing protein [Subtercola boreus]RFA09863.1 hypothetical protein B7R54_12110 [Subtercola boreus]TQL53009.1 uncharacterized protein (DUF58 family) [Subtercola boreus]
MSAPSGPAALFAFLRTEVPRPTFRGWGFLVAGIVLLVIMNVLQRRDLSFVALFVLALPVLAAVGVSLYRFPLIVDRRFTPELAAAGSPVEVRLLLQNRGLFGTPEAVWFDDAAAPLVASARAPLPRLRRSAGGSGSGSGSGGASGGSGGAPTTFGYSLEARHRGEHLVGPLTVLLSDPFGMVIRTVRIGRPDLLTVTPSTVPLPRGAVRLASGAGSAPASRQLGGAGEQDVISRKYQTGDSMRRVNWSATARFGELMVRQDDQQNDQHAVVILDCAATGYAAAHHRFSPEFEWAVSMSTSIALHLLGEGFQVRHIDAVGARFDPSSPEELLLHAARTTVIEPEADTDSAPTGVDYRLAVSRTESAAGDLPPLFAVVGRLDDASLHSLASSARFSSGAVAIIVTPPGAALSTWAVAERQTLESAGWTTQVITSDEAPSAAWGTVDGERLVL